ncbi:acidic leucine-rich nuclear phosphoprotein 32 family member A [Tanacetum coccineum]
MQVVTHPNARRSGYPANEKGYFNLRSHLNDETTIMVNGKKKTIGSMVHAGLRKDFQDRYSDNKFKFKRRHFTKQPTVKDARDNKPSGWQLGDDEWQKLIDYWLNPKQMAKSTKNAQNRSKNKTPTYQGSKSYAQGRHEFFKRNKRYEDLVNHWRRTHTDRTGRFHSGESEELYLIILRASNLLVAARCLAQCDYLLSSQCLSTNEGDPGGCKSKKIPFKTDKDIVREVIQSTNRGHETGVGRMLPGTSSRSSSLQPASGYCTQEEADRLRKENEELKKAVQSQQLEWLKFVNHFNAHQTDVTTRPMKTNTSQIVHLDGDDLDVDGDGSGSLDGDGSGSLDGSDSDDDSNDASDEE